MFPPEFLEGQQHEKHPELLAGLQYSIVVAIGRIVFFHSHSDVEFLCRWSRLDRRRRNRGLAQRHHESCCSKHSKRHTSDLTASVDDFFEHWPEFWEPSCLIQGGNLTATRRQQIRMRHDVHIPCRTNGHLGPGRDRCSVYGMGYRIHRRVKEPAKGESVQKYKKSRSDLPLSTIQAEYRTLQGHKESKENIVHTSS